MVFPDGEIRAAVVYVHMHTNKSLNDMPGCFLVKITCFNKEEVLGNSLIRFVFEPLL